MGDYDRLHELERERDLQDRMLTHKAWDGCNAVIIHNSGNVTHLASGGRVLKRSRMSSNASSTKKPKKADLEKRLKPIVDKLDLSLRSYCRGRGTLLELPGDYQGVVDIFLPRREVGSRYFLALDKKHKKYGLWGRSLKVNSKHFRFNPTAYFDVQGEIEKSGEINNFQYYIVRVTKVKKK